MTNQEAITSLKMLKLFTGYDAKSQITLTLHISIDMAIEALEKATPKKPTFSDNNYQCSSCGWEYLDDITLQKHCEHCGQCLKWEE